jgi:hypothetical protein
MTYFMGLHNPDLVLIGERHSLIRLAEQGRKAYELDLHRHDDASALLREDQHRCRQQEHPHTHVHGSKHDQKDTYGAPFVSDVEDVVTIGTDGSEVEA